MNDAVSAQVDYVRISAQRAVAEAGRVATESLKLAEQVLAPLNARLQAAVAELTQAA